MQNKKILIVEDEASLLKAFVQKFKDESFLTLEARDGIKGLEIALKEHPDLILIDIIMPKLDGIGMLKKIREDAWGKNVKVIMLTNLSDNKKLNEAKKWVQIVFSLKQIAK
jgi:DNA-binding response OmpR family regulator